MSVSQQHIADRLGIDRTSVTKILNRSPRHHASPQTVELVFKTAREMGYDFSRLRNIHRREYDRKAVDCQAELTIITEGTRVFDRGQGRIKNLSASGAYISMLAFPGGALPVTPFRIELTITEGDLAGLHAKCEVAWLKSYPVVDLGVSFVEIDKADKDRIVTTLAA